MPVMVLLHWLSLGPGQGPGSEPEQWVSVAVPVQVQCERFYIKPHSLFVQVPASVPAPVPETASVIEP